MLSRVCDYLAVARVCLEIAEPDTSALINRLQAVEQQLDAAQPEYRGDVRNAVREIELMLTDLQKLAQRPRIAAGANDAMRQLRFAMRVLDKARAGTAMRAVSG